MGHFVEKTPEEILPVMNLGSLSTMGWSIERFISPAHHFGMMGVIEAAVEQLLKKLHFNAGSAALDRPHHSTSTQLTDQVLKGALLLISVNG